MILQELARYYERKHSADDSDIAPPGTEKQVIPFIFVINREGQFIDIDDTRESAGIEKKGRSFLVPQAVKRAANIKANLLWDNIVYVLGIDTKGNVEKAVKRHESFLLRIQEVFSDPTIDEGIRAVTLFFANEQDKQVLKHPLWPEVFQSTGNVTFRLDGDVELICQRRTVFDKILDSAKVSDANSLRRCLISGELDEVAILHTAIKNVWGAQTAGANIVSFNLPSCTSFGKVQGDNAPIGKRSMFAYTTGLNDLLSKTSKQRMQVGDASTVFWSERPHQMESLLFDLFAEVPKDDPARRTNFVRKLFSAPETGVLPFSDDETRFFVLGLAPNAARISIRFWQASTIKDIAGNLRQYFTDIALEHNGSVHYDSVFRLLASTALEHRAENIIPNMSGDFMNAILSGTAFPRTVLGAAIRRLRSGDEARHTIVSLLKGYIARLDRVHKYSNEELKVSLDESNQNIAYRLGRLFAVLERAQELANPGINTTIRDRYYGGASASPVTVFAQLLRLKNHHIAKLDNKGHAVFLEKLIGQIVDGINDFPAHLSLGDQGRFAVGYYHQRQAFFNKSTTND